MRNLYLNPNNTPLIKQADGFGKTIFNWLYVLFNLNFLVEQYNSNTYTDEEIQKHFE